MLKIEDLDKLPIEKLKTISQKHWYYYQTIDKIIKYKELKEEVEEWIKNYKKL